MRHHAFSRYTVFKISKRDFSQLLMIKEALIGEHNLNPLLAVYKRTIDWYSLLGNKPVTSQVYSYDILVINSHPWLRLWIRVITRISYS